MKRLSRSDNKKIKVAVGLSGGVDFRQRRTSGSGSQKLGKRVAVGLSGGVDSAVAAALLIEGGFDVTGVHLECWSEPGCRAPQDRKDALAVAMHLGIPFEVLDYQKEYKEKVIEYFYREYKAGRTPNPDVMCNLEIKFGLFMQWVLKKGYDYVATGHYARICERVQNYTLLRGKDETKDQSYFLYRLRQEQLERILFPVGDLTKKQVRAKAKKLKLPVADKPDSQGICFIGEINVREFLKRRIREKKGEVVMRKARSTKHEARSNLKIKNSNIQNVSDFDIRNSDLRENYEVIGEHRGVWFYTIGQRMGLRGGKVTSNKRQATRIRRGYLENLRKLGFDPRNLPPLYVVGKDIAQNRLVVGTEKDVERSEFEVGEVHWINGKLKVKSEKLLVRIRHGGKLISAKLKVQNEKLLVRLSEPERGIAPGQSAVFYLPAQAGMGEECLGGGVVND